MNFRNGKTLSILSITNDYVIEVPSETGPISTIKNAVARESGIQEDFQHYFHSNHKLHDNSFYNTSFMDIGNPLQLVEMKVLVKVILQQENREFSWYFSPDSEVSKVRRALNENSEMGDKSYDFTCEHCSDLALFRISDHSHENDVISFSIQLWEKPYSGIESPIVDIIFQNESYNQFPMKISLYWSIGQLMGLASELIECGEDEIMLSFGTKNICWDKRNSRVRNWGIRDGSTIAIHKFQQFKEACIPMLDFNNLDNKIEIQFSENPFKWRSAQKGISFIGICKNINCVAYNEFVVDSMGFGVFTMNSLDPHCPMENCRAAIEYDICGFYMAKWKFNGLTTSREKKTGRGETKTQCFAIFKEEGIIQWRALKIEVVPL